MEITVYTDVEGSTGSGGGPEAVVRDVCVGLYVLCAPVKVLFVSFSPFPLIPLNVKSSVSHVYSRGVPV